MWAEKTKKKKNLDLKHPKSFCGRSSIRAGPEMHCDEEHSEPGLTREMTPDLYSQVIINHRWNVSMPH